MKNLDRFKKIVERQADFRWGDTYSPAIHATRVEAPKISRVSMLYSQKLGRNIHLHSLPERYAALLAIYHPQLFDLHEQRHLSPCPAIHPLQGHPLADRLQYPPLKGTVAVAERMGFLKNHPSVYVFDEEEGVYVKLPFPYVGDLLLYLISGGGQPYCMNWTVKKDQEDFVEKNRNKVKTRSRKSSDQANSKIRHLIEEGYYKDAGIKTVRVAQSDFDKNVILNLNFLLGWANRESSLPQEMADDFMSSVRSAMDNGLPVCKLVLKYSVGSVEREDLLCTLYRSIWQRKLLVDLFSPIVIDKPLRPQLRDVIDVYRSFFDPGIES